MLDVRNFGNSAKHVRRVPSNQWPLVQKYRSFLHLSPVNRTQAAVLRVLLCVLGGNLVWEALARFFQALFQSHQCSSVDVFQGNVGPQCFLQGFPAFPVLIASTEAIKETRVSDPTCSTCHLSSLPKMVD